MKRFYVLTSFRGCVLSWLTTLNLDRGNDRSFDIYYYNFPMGTYLKHFINVYRCVYWMKSTSFDGLDVPYIRPWLLNKYSRLQHFSLSCKTSDFFFWLLWTTMRFLHSSSMNTSLGEFSMFPMSSISI